MKRHLTALLFVLTGMIASSVLLQLHSFTKCSITFLIPISLTLGFLGIVSGVAPTLLMIWWWTEGELKKRLDEIGKLFEKIYLWIISKVSSTKRAELKEKK